MTHDFWPAVSYYDPNSPIAEYIYHYILPFAILFLIVVVFPLLLLTLYPFKIFRKVLFYICCKDLRCVQSFVNSFQGYYKDGTSRTCDYRIMASLQLICRFYFHFNLFRWYNGGRRYQAEMIYTNIILIIMSILYFTVKPFKKSYMTTIEALLYSAAAITSFLIGTLDFKRPDHYAMRYMVMFLIALPSVVLLALFTYKLVIKIPICRSAIFSLKNCLWKQKEAVEESLPHRMISPKEYTPLI